MMHEIKITVEGPCGTGKTRICQMIADVLKAHGVVVSVPRELDLRTNYMEVVSMETLKTALRDIGRRSTVKIIEKVELKPLP